MRKIENLAFVVNGCKPKAESLAHTLIKRAEKLGITTAYTHDYPLKKGFLKSMDACCVLGGDGTLLSTVQESVDQQVPVFGINQGKLGFLATFTPEEILQDLDRILQGHYTIIKRSVLECKPSNGSPTVALNDIVIKGGNPCRLTNLQVFSNEDWLTNYACDGLIFCSPTGSTAYNLSAGGPIVTPGSSIMTMTPICPHTLTNRSVVFAQNTQLKVDRQDPEQVLQLSLDGIDYPQNSFEFPIELSISSKNLLLLQSPNHTYFEILRQKLKWGSEPDGN